MRIRPFWTQALLDAAALVVAVAAASMVSFGTPFPWQFEARIWPLLLIMLGGLIAAEGMGAWLLIGGPQRPSYGRALAVAFMILATTSLMLIATRVYFSRSFISWAMVFFVIGAFAHRAWLRRHPWTEAMILITGEKALVEDLRATSSAQILDVVDPSSEVGLDPPGRRVVLGVDFRSALSDRMAQYVSSCTLAGLDVRPLSGIYELHTGRIPVLAPAEGWEMSMPMLRTVPYLAGKRVFDVLAVLVTAPITLVLAAVTAIVIRFGSSGPVVFRQARVGKGGKPFIQYKFRSMWHDPGRNGASFTSRDDERVVPVARILRRFRLDELPQLWNVIKGDLSLVGPRPEQVEFVDRFNRTIPFYSQRHLIRPGITGWAQVNYGYADGEEDTIQKLAYDLFYVKHMSPWLDLEILGRSCWTVLSGFGAR